MGIICDRLSCQLYCILAGSERVKGYATKANWKRCSLIAQFSVILRKSGRTYLENFGYNILYIYIYRQKCQ